jgi:hypothetical protein
LSLTLKVNEIGQPTGRTMQTTHVRVPVEIKADIEQAIAEYRQRCRSVRDQAGDAAIQAAHPQIKQDLGDRLRQLVGSSPAQVA